MKVGAYNYGRLVGMEVLCVEVDKSGGGWEWRWVRVEVEVEVRVEVDESGGG